MTFNKDVWNKLDSQLPEGDTLAVRLALPEISRKLYAGMDADKQRHLLILLDDDEEGYTDTHSRGLTAATKELTFEGTTSKEYIDIICHDQSGHIIFDVVGEELASQLGSGESKDVVRNVMARWRYFWGQPPRDLLSREELIGLSAEIWFLTYWLLPKMNALEAVTGWRGPFAARHDFEWPGKSIEVKATTNTQSRVHRIHGIEQLTPPTNGRLLFFSATIREEQGAENTLPRLITQCRELLKSDPDALAHFENALAIAGYSPLYEEEYSTFRFRIVTQKLYEVREGFPRLTPVIFQGGVPPGVSVIEYSITLDGFEEFCLASSPADKFAF